VSLGWIGVLFLAVMIVRGYRSIMASYRQNPDTARFRLAFFLIVIVSSFTEAAFRTEGISWIAFLLMTMAIPGEHLRGRVRIPGVTVVSSGHGRLETVAVGSSSQQPVPEVTL